MQTSEASQSSKNLGFCDWDQWCTSSASAFCPGREAWNRGATLLRCFSFAEAAWSSACGLQLRWLKGMVWCRSGARGSRVAWTGATNTPIKGRRGWRASCIWWHCVSRSWQTCSGIRDGAGCLALVSALALVCQLLFAGQALIIGSAVQLLPPNSFKLQLYRVQLFHLQRCRTQCWPSGLCASSWVPWTLLCGLAMTMTLMQVAKNNWVLYSGCVCLIFVSLFNDMFFFVDNFRNVESRFDWNYTRTFQQKTDHAWILNTCGAWENWLLGTPFFTFILHRPPETNHLAK